MPDMYAFQPLIKPAETTENGPSTPQLNPNILPCRIHHDGPIDSIDRFWTPVTDAKDNTHTSYFRGRKLRGRRVAVPEGYQGIVALPTDREVPTPQRAGQDAEAEAEAEVVEIIPEEPVKILETQGTFDEMIVWGHEYLPAADDSYVKGVEEWVKFAEMMHGTPAKVTSEDKK